jgi:hypothetical protein
MRSDGSNEYCTRTATQTCYDPAQCHLLIDVELSQVKRKSGEHRPRSSVVEYMLWVALLYVVLGSNPSEALSFAFLVFRTRGRSKRLICYYFCCWSGRNACSKRTWRLRFTDWRSMASPHAIIASGPSHASGGTPCASSTSWLEVPRATAVNRAFNGSSSARPSSILCFGSPTQTFVSFDHSALLCQRSEKKWMLCITS